MDLNTQEIGRPLSRTLTCAPGWSWLCPNYLRRFSGALRRIWATARLGLTKIGVSAPIWVLFGI
jgi:hypothetical protein